jgi:hypothetical protein
MRRTRLLTLDPRKRKPRGGPTKRIVGTTPKPWQDGLLTQNNAVADQRTKQGRRLTPKLTTTRRKGKNASGDIRRSMNRNVETIQFGMSRSKRQTSVLASSDSMESPNISTMNSSRLVMAAVRSARTLLISLKSMKCTLTISMTRLDGCAAFYARSAISALVISKTVSIFFARQPYI